MNNNDYAEANRAAWNETAPIHAAQTFGQLLAGFRQAGYSCLHKPHEVERLRALELAGKNVAQLCCNNGRELLSLKNLFGAARCVGFDISDGFIEQARQLNAAAKQDLEFVRSSVFEIPSHFDGQFDLVYITIGALGWLPELPAFWAVVKRLLKVGGQVLIYEMHPFLDMLDSDEATKNTNPLALKHSYFKTTPYIETQGLDYYGNTSYDSKTMYWFHHKLSDILGGLIGQGFIISAFDEFDHDISGVFEHLNDLDIKPPLCYILEARKG
jgi:ubiquinone/menaquinone biosynthesis C-methylase UbiE